MSCGGCRGMERVTGSTRGAESHGRTERRIAWLTLVIGGAGAAAVAVVGRPRAGAGVLVGALLAWLNLRWLQQALDALVRLSTARPDIRRPRISVWVYVKFFARYALIGLVLYAMVRGLGVPVLSMLMGLLSLGAATVTASIYEVLARPD